MVMDEIPKGAVKKYKGDGTPIYVMPDYKPGGPIWDEKGKRIQ